MKNFEQTKEDLQQFLGTYTPHLTARQYNTWEPMGSTRLKDWINIPDALQDIINEIKDDIYKFIENSLIELLDEKAQNLLEVIENDEDSREYGYDGIEEQVWDWFTENTADCRKEIEQKLKPLADKLEELEELK